MQKADLLRKFGDPEDIYSASQAALAQIQSITPKALENLENKDLTKARKILDACSEKCISILTYGDAAYPKRLKHIASPPLVLYYKGVLPDWESRPVIGMVGTRKASAYGLQIAERIGNQIAGCGGMVVSGGADGIDTQALLGAMQTGQKVVAVLGCGADVVYPAKNRWLFEDIQKQGCLLTEFCPGTPANSWNFPIRNRIISGLSLGVVVVEAPERSGALSTARHADEQGRDVFVVPGNVNTLSCAGSNRLLRERAIAVFEGWDVIQEYESLYPNAVKRFSGSGNTCQKVAQTREYPRVNQKAVDKKGVDNPEKSRYSVEDNEQPDLTQEEQAVMSCLTAKPILVDEVIAATSLPAGKVLSILTMLAMKGAVQNHPGKLVSLK